MSIPKQNKVKGIFVRFTNLLSYKIFFFAVFRFLFVFVFYGIQVSCQEQVSFFIIFFLRLVEDFSWSKILLYSFYDDSSIGFRYFST